MAGRLPLRFAATIVFFFSFLLFISGWILQQKSLTALQAAMIQPVPSPHVAASSKHKPKPPFQLIDQTNNIPVLRSKKNLKAAHFQFVQKKENVCHSLMVLAELARLGTGADKILLYPESWIGTEEGTWSRLLKAAEKRFEVKVRAVGGLGGGALGDAGPSLLHAFAETKYDRILYLEPLGLPLRNLDHLLYGTLTAPVVGTRSYWLPKMVQQLGPLSGQVLLLTPSTRLFNKTKKLQLENPEDDSISIINDLLSSHSLILPQHPYATNIFEFRAVDHSKYTLNDWDPVKVSEESYYISFMDQSAPMPWFTWPREVTDKVRPKVPDDAMVWKALYDRWARVRMNVCGLDLEYLRQN
ncbi:Glycosyltransferase Family 8 protein [Tuber magnatum]|uniref:Glycosyltransferase Family 8 protein n=1 Tax=Tuber magnatum TaxID=42249 RepID=A0A317T0S7_9PEZI|nr:Glycosyltransferase Family 8 protein [Tuber magnatum]